MNLKEVKLSKLLSQVKEKIILDDLYEYNLVTISGTGDIKLREVVKGSSIKGSSMFKISAGNFIYSRLSIHNGAYGLIPDILDNAIVTSEMPSFKISPLVLPEFLLYSLKLPFFQFQMEQLTKGVGRTRVKEDAFLSFKMQLPNLDEQNKILKKLKKAESIYLDFQNELPLQKQLLSQLKQAILQEAIQGKLTVEWRKSQPNLNSESNSTKNLLYRIKAEKEQLIKDGKIKKEKPLPPITKEEIPFELPEGWVWLRPQDVCMYIIDCPHSTPKFIENGKLCIDSTCVNMDGQILTQKIRKVSEVSFIERNNRLTPKPGDIVYVREGIIGQAVILPENFEFCLGQRVMLFRVYSEIHPKLFRFIITSKFFLKSIERKHKGMGAKHINMSDLRSLPIPLPSLLEQKAIIEKVEKLMQKCQALEEEMEQSETNAQMLMQAVLKEAFES